MVSRIPPASPASIMLVVRSSKILGYWRMALESVDPPSTLCRTPVRHFWKTWFSWFGARISRHWTRGRPASIMTKNCRKKTAVSLTGTLPVPSLGRANSLPFSLMAPGVMRSRRNCMVTAALVSANRSPATFLPCGSVPVNVNTGIPCTPLVLFATDFACQLRGRAENFYLLSTLRRGRCSFWGLHATINHVLQLIGHGRTRQRGLQRDGLLEIKRRQRLVKRLHAEL